MVPANGAAVHLESTISGFDVGVDPVIKLDGGPSGFDRIAAIDHGTPGDYADYMHDAAFRSAVRDTANKYIREQHTDLLKAHARQLQKLVEHDALKAAFDATVTHRDRLRDLVAEVEKRCEALIKLYPADAINRDDQGGKALKAISDLVTQIKSLKG